MSWYSSIKPFCANWEIMLPLPMMTMSSPDSCLHFLYFPDQIVFYEFRIFPRGLVHGSREDHLRKIIHLFGHHRAYFLPRLV